MTAASFDAFVAPSAWDAGIGLGHADNAGMELAPDWLSVVNLCLTAILGWKTLGPRRKTKLSILLRSGIDSDYDDKNEYRRLVIMNQGHYPAHGLTLELNPNSSGPGLTSLHLGDLVPWETKLTRAALRNYEGNRLLATYRDADNKLRRARLTIRGGYVWGKMEEVEPITLWAYRKKDSIQVQDYEE